MSARLEAVLGHTLRGWEDVAALPRRLQDVSNLSRRVGQLYWGDEWGPLHDCAEWTAPPLRGLPPEQYWEQYGHLMFDGPGHNIIEVARHCVIVTTIAKWRYSQLHAELLSAANDFFGALGLLLGSETFLVRHTDDLGTDAIFSGCTLEQELDRLRRAGWSQVPSWESMAISSQEMESPRYQSAVFYVGVPNVNGDRGDHGV